MGGATVDAMALIGIVLLLVLLFQKELASVVSSRNQWFVKVLNVGITPLLFVFVLVVVSKVIEVLP